MSFSNGRYCELIDVKCVTQVSEIIKACIAKSESGGIIRAATRQADPAACLGTALYVRCKECTVHDAARSSTVLVLVSTKTKTKAHSVGLVTCNWPQKTPCSCSCCSCSATKRSLSRYGCSPLIIVPQNGGGTLLLPKLPGAFSHHRPLLRWTIAGGPYLLPKVVHNLGDGQLLTTMMQPSRSI